MPITIFPAIPHRLLASATSKTDNCLPYQKVLYSSYSSAFSTLQLVLLPLLDPAGNTGSLRCASDRLGHGFGNLRVEHSRNNVILVQLGRRYDRGNRLCCSQLHLLIYVPGVTVDRTTEDTREAQY